MKCDLFERTRKWIGYVALATLPVHTVWIIFEPVPGWEYGKYAIFLTAVLWGVYVGLSAWKHRHGTRIVHTEWFFAILFIVALSAFAWFFNGYSYIVAAHILGFIIVSGIFAYAKDLFDSKKGWYALGVGITVVLCVSIMQLITGYVFASAVFGIAAQNAGSFSSSIVFHAGEPMLRLYGTFAHPNIFAAWLTIGLILVFAYRNNILPLVRYILFGVLLVLLLFTFSRSAIIGFVVFALVYVLLKKDIRSFIPFVLIAFAIGTTHMSLYTDTWTDRIGAGNSFERNSVSERVDQYVALKKILGEYAPFGTGPGSYTAAVYDMHSEVTGKYLQPVHSAWVLFVSEWGIAGLLIVIAAAYVFAKSKPDAIMIAYVCFVFTTGLFDHYWITSFHLVASAAIGFVLLRRL